MDAYRFSVMITLLTVFYGPGPTVSARFLNSRQGKRNFKPDGVQELIGNTESDLQRKILVPYVERKATLE